jgi:hypothetical protein
MLRIAACLLALVGCIDGGDDADPAEDSLVETASLPEFHGRFGSPTIVRDGDALHAYFAIQSYAHETVHVAHARSDDGGTTWFRIGDALPRLNTTALATGSVWAPGAAKIDDDHWMLYYTAQVAGTVQKMCTYRAHAAGPHGPFVDDFNGPIICPDNTLWAIDPYPVRDAHGDWHLMARVDEPNGVNTIQIRKLGEYGQHFAPGSEWKKLTQITKGGWEEPVMENAAMVRLDGRWYVFYSGGSYRNNSYGVGYADCGASINGPCVKKTVAGPWLSSKPALDMYGPGTPTFFRDGHGHTMMAVNTWKYSGGQTNPKNHGQVMHIFEVHIASNGKPVATFVRMVE